MAAHKLNPREGEVWENPRSLMAFRIHSLTDDGWVRYSHHMPGDSPGHVPYPIFTRPTLDFVKLYQKAGYDNESVSLPTQFLNDHGDVEPWYDING